MGSGQVLWTCTGTNKTLPLSTSLLVMGEIAGVNTASLGGYLHNSKTRARWAEGCHDELNGHVFDLERNGPSDCTLLVTHHAMTTTIPYRIGRRPGQQGPRFLPYTRTEVPNMLLAHHRRFVEQTTAP